MKKILTSAQMTECDRRTIETTTPSSVLMERAAHAVYNVLHEKFNTENTLVVCGSGNNGGDGLLVAIELFSNGYDCDIWYVGEDHQMSEETQKRYRQATDMGIPFCSFPDVDSYSVVVDAIFGTGLLSAPHGLAELAIKAVNNSYVPVLSIDIPSGISADTGKGEGVFITADMTVTMEAYKRGHTLCDGIDASGVTLCASLGIDTASAFSDRDFSPFAIEDKDLSLIPRRRRNSHKGTYGRILLIAGSKGMCGAAFLSAFAAYRCGAGLIEIFTHESNLQILQGLIPEAIITSYNTEIPDKRLLVSSVEKATVIVIGPGIGTDDSARLCVREVFRSCNSPIIVDADALNVVASESLSFPTDVPVIVTPHPGELSRLTGKSIKELSADVWGSAVCYARDNDVICISKFPRTVITDGTNLFVNMSGGPSLAKAGSGDVLTGIIAGMLGSGLSPIGAASLGVYIHGKAGDIAAEKLSTYSPVARDIIDAIPYVMKNAKGKE